MQPCGKDRGNGATGTGQSAVGGKTALANVGFFEKVHEGPKSFHGIERVQVEPVVFERSPKGFDRGVGLGDVNLGEDAPKAGLKECGVHVGVSAPVQRCLPAVIKTAQVAKGSRRSPIVQPKILREWLSMTAWM